MAFSLMSLRLGITILSIYCRVGNNVQLMIVNCCNSASSI